MLPPQAPLAAGQHQPWQPIAHALPNHNATYKLIGDVFKKFNGLVGSTAEGAWFVPGLHVAALAMKRMNEIMENNRSADVSHETTQCCCCQPMFTR